MKSPGSGSVVSPEPKDEREVQGGEPVGEPKGGELNPAQQATHCNP